MSDVPDKERFEEMYQGKPPWDIGKPQTVFVQAADQITGAVLDAGCGTGENALFFAARGQRVTGIDFLEQPIAEATRKAHQRGLDATFLVMDALRLEALLEVFDSAIDCGLFHVFSDEDRSNYVASLSSVVKPGGRLFLACFSDKEPPGEGPRRVTLQELRDAFSDGWLVESIREARLEGQTGGRRGRSEPPVPVIAATRGQGAAPVAPYAAPALPDRLPRAWPRADQQPD